MIYRIIPSIRKLPFIFSFTSMHFMTQRSWAGVWYISYCPNEWSLVLRYFNPCTEYEILLCYLYFKLPSLFVLLTLPIYHSLTHLSTYHCLISEICSESSVILSHSSPQLWERKSSRNRKRSPTISSFRYFIVSEWRIRSLKQQPRHRRTLLKSVCIIHSPKHLTNVGLTLDQLDHFS